LADLELLKVYRDRNWRLWKQDGNYVVDFGDHEPIVVKVPEGYEEQEIVSALDLILGMRYKKGRELCLTNESLMRYVLEKVMIRTRSRATLKNCVEALVAVMKKVRKTPDQLVEMARRDREGVERMLVGVLKSFMRNREHSESIIQTWRSYLKKFFVVNGIDIKLNIEFPCIYYRYESECPTPAQVVEMIDLATNPRDKAIISMLATSGLRIGTLLRLKYKHLKRDLEAGRIPVAIHVPAEITKGKYMSYITFINLEAVTYLKLWLKEWERLVGRKIRDDDYIFISLKYPRPDKPITPLDWTPRVFNRIRERMGIKRHEGRVKRFVITPHGLRKFFRTQMARGGANEMAIEYMMGHRTGAYMRVEALGEEWLRDQYLRGRLKLRRWRPSREETLRLLREQLRNLGYSEEEMDEFIRSAMTLIQAGYNIEEIIYLKT